MSKSDDAEQKKLLRKSIRAKRRSLSPKKLSLANRAMIKQLVRSQTLLHGKHIALYIGNGGEICPKDLIDILSKWKRNIYLPVLHPLVHDRMVFCRVDGKTNYIKNRFGIVEPDFRRAKTIPPRCLAIVFMPLVAFDSNGNRMGMGGGFYDRTFEFKFTSSQKTPKLIGLAHEFQKVDSLPTESWDVPMIGTATDKAFYFFKRQK